MARDPCLPCPGDPRRFYAVAMPNGDARHKIEGQLVFVQQQRAGHKEPATILTRAEAEQLRDELDRALRTFFQAAELAAGTDRPRAYTGPWPIRGPSLAEVDAAAGRSAAA